MGETYICGSQICSAIYRGVEEARESSPGADCYTLGVAAAFGIEPASVTPQMRQMAKTLTFCQCYRMSAFKALRSSLLGLLPGLGSRGLPILKKTIENIRHDPLLKPGEQQFRRWAFGLIHDSLLLSSEEIIRSKTDVLAWAIGEATEEIVTESGLGRIRKTLVKVGFSISQVEGRLV